VGPEDRMAYGIARSCRDQLDVEFHAAERTDQRRRPAATVQARDAECFA
jgi:hypothetical protein